MFQNIGKFPMKLRKIDFSPPDITRKEISRVIKVLKSGWITTGPVTKEFEKKIASYLNCEKVICLNSATAGMELVLRLFGIKEGDEVITTCYTFASTANVIIHTGAKPVFVDVKKESFNIDPEEIEKRITEKTKAIITVDFGGYPVDYDEIKMIIERNRNKYKSNFKYSLNRILFLADCAHSFGAEYNSKKTGTLADFSVFSFHAVKNLTTAEGGAICFNSIENFSSDTFYKEFQLFSLHGQDKDALSKIKEGQWKYDIKLAGYKYNMTDIQAALGLAQLERYNKILKKRETLFNYYNELLKNHERFILPPFNEKNKKPSYHLYPLRIQGLNEEKRDLLIEKLKEVGISCNVHFIPLVMHSYYKNSGYSINDFPNSYQMYKNEISLPLHTKLKYNDIEYTVDNLLKIIKRLNI